MADPAKRHRAALEERVSRSPSRKALQIECERCGEQMSIERAGRFRDDDYLELLHDYFAIEQRIRQYAKAHKGECDQAFATQADAWFWQNQAVLYRAQLIAAGIEPMDAEVPAEATAEAFPF